jgi:hypothetical protein
MTNARDILPAIVRHAPHKSRTQRNGTKHLDNITDADRRRAGRRLEQDQG